MDNRHYVKWFDMDYHRKSPHFKEPPEGAISTIIRFKDEAHGWATTVCNYKLVDGEWQVHINAASDIANGKFAAATKFFVDTENITDEEWGLFVLCYPEVDKGLGASTYTTSAIELYLTGRKEIQETALCEIP